MNRNWERVVHIVLGGLLFFLLDRMVVMTVPRDFTLRQQGQAQVLEMNKGSNSVSAVASSVPVDKSAVKGKATVYRYTDNGFVRLHDFCTWSVRVDCVMLNTNAGTTPFHIHAVKDDVWVSGQIKKSGKWEGGMVNLVMTELQKDPEYGFLDIGSHVGIYSINAAKLGRKVVSVDPLIENTQRLCKSIQKGGFTNQMTIIFNPLSDQRAHVSFKTVADNIGASTLTLKQPENKSGSPCDDVVDHPTAMLDDIIPLVPFKKAVIKMDVEEHEYHVLNGGRKFLKEINVAVIFMEWARIKLLPEQPEKLLALLQEFGYKAYMPVINGQWLDPKNWRSWPGEVLFRKV